MSKKRPKPRGGPRTVNRKKKIADAFRVLDDNDVTVVEVPPYDEEAAKAFAINTAGPYEEAVGLAGDAPLQVTQPEAGTPYTPAPAPWGCLCGEAHNSALVEECPVCHTKRPYDYTPSVPVLAVPSDYPQPGESMEDYAIRMKGKTVSSVPRETPPTDAEMDAEIALAESASIGPWTTEQREGWKERRLAQWYVDHPVDPGRKRELPDITSGPVSATGYASPFTFAGPVGSVDVDPLVLQMVMDVANKAASTGQVMSVTVGLKNPSQARCIIRYDLDVASVAWPRAVKDEG